MSTSCRDGEVHLAIDGDLLLYRVLAATEEEVDFGNGVWLMFTRPEEAFEGVLATVQRLREAYGASRVFFALSDPSGRNFRKDLWPDYKGHRSGRKPMCYALVRDWCLEREVPFEVVHRPALEADDVLGILSSIAYRRRAKPGAPKLLMVTDDKDLKGVPGFLVPLWGAEQHPVFPRETSPNEAVEWHLRQTVVGDPSEGFKGAKGAGPAVWEKAVARALEGQPPFEEIATPQLEGLLWGVVLRLYERAKMTAEEALLNARLAKVLTCDLWDAERRKPCLWSPPVTP